MLNLDPVSALILSVLTAWVQMLSRAMSSCQLLRFICSDLMDQLQTPFSAMSTEGQLRHLHIMGRTMPRLLTATQPDPTYSTHTDWQVPAHTGSPFPHKQQQGESGQLCPAVCAGTVSHMQKFHLTLCNKDQTYYMAQTVSLLVNGSFSTVLNTVFLLWSKKHTAKSGPTPYLKDLWTINFWLRCVISIAFQKKGKKK